MGRRNHQSCYIHSAQMNTSGRYVSRFKICNLNCLLWLHTAHGSYPSIGDAKHTFIPSYALLPLYKLILIILRVR